MSILKPVDITCTCGTIFGVDVAHGGNINRFPKMRDQILAGTFHRVFCPNCGQQRTVEKCFLYSDFGRKTLIRVQPRKSRHLWRGACELLREDLEKVPKNIGLDEGLTRVVFGMTELTEKLLIQDAQLDDRLLEWCKMVLISDQPMLIKKPLMRIFFTRVQDEKLVFQAMFDHSEAGFEVTLPRTVYDTFSVGPHVKAWLARFQGGEGYWVNLWRFSPRNEALARLHAFARQIEQGGDMDFDAAGYQTMMANLPRGDRLPSWAKADLGLLFRAARDTHNPKAQDALFELRFAVTLDDDWGYNSSDTDIETLWNIMRDLPDSNAEGNTYISQINLSGGSGGFYRPGIGEISIGDGLTPYQEYFEDVVRHEVGHAVQEQLDQEHNYRVYDWLVSRFGWQMFGPDDADVDRWVQLMGGYGGMSSPQRNQVRARIRQCLGPGGRWEPPILPALPTNHPWNTTDFGPRLAFEKTCSHWYKSHALWHRHDGNAFFYNFNYKMLMAVEETTLDLVSRMPDNYAAMSPYEFFAEMYALYYDLDDPQRGVIPQDVATWFHDNVGDPNP